MPTFAEIAVDTYQDPSKRLFTYFVPENLRGSIREGMKVVIPFGKRVVEGYVWSIEKEKPAFQTKEIKEIKGQGFTEAQVKLAAWMSSYYLASPLDCLKCQIPGKGERVALGSLDKITTLLLIPYANQVRLRAATLRTLKDQPLKVLVGSRSAVFAQLPNLKKIIVEEPENWNYKDERSPYYHVKDIAEKRAELEGLELELRQLSPPNLTRRVGVVDLNREKAAGNFTLVSQTLEDLAKLPKLIPELARGHGSRAEREVHTLVYANSKELREKVREELQRIGIDRNFVEIAGPELFSLLGKAVDHIVWADVDTLFNLPDFRAHEKIVWTVQKLVQRITFKGSTLQGGLYLQTSYPNHPLFAELATGDLESFSKREQKVRQELGFPPFSRLVKLSFTGKSSAKVNFEAEKLYEELTANSKRLMAIEISPPYHAFGGRRFSSEARGSYQPYLPVAGKFHLNIAIKVSKSSKVSKSLAKLSRLIPPEWRIEVDPESLL